eukprot:TRINITY_DN20182_c0_g1_i1.p1 TRINITY_DN20182_c0_g1~~TRINITY_DN20182_c0_g1_i1.p1  ORF type:complete len:192 (-),score=28.39 TRINITY_DN20182_c0_g1_i1:69-644(-)
MKSIFATVVCLLLCLCYCRAQLVVRKHLLNRELVYNQDVTVQVEIYNTKSSPLYSLTLDDTSNGDGWELVAGLQLVSWDKLAGNSNISHTYIVRPQILADADSIPSISQAKVSYLDAPKGNRFEASSSQVNALKIVRKSESERRTAPHLKEWGVFIVLALLAITGPFSVWSYYTVTFKNGIPRKRKRTRVA